MPCPFGFSAGADEGADASGEEEPDIPENGPVFCAGEVADGEAGAEGEERHPIKKKSKKKGGNAENKGRFDFDTDPVSWFYQNQIKSEEDFQARKADLRAEARRRLDAIMAKKQQHILWPSDSEFDDISISSEELSDLDSDVHSMHSLRSCADSWEERAHFKRPAESCTYWVALCTLALSAWSIHVSTHLQHWPTYAVLTALGMATASGCMLAGTHFRAKRIVLASQVMSIMAYGAAVLLSVQLFLLPIQVDVNLTEKACARFSRADRSSRMCQMLPGVQDYVSHTMAQLKYSEAGLAACGLLVAAFGAWYVLELCFVEKKSIKHLRRHKRNKHKIPWEKIKIEGPVTNCGSGAKPAGGAAKQGGGSKSKCPVMH
ncbi:hypothetical protein DUNSADRAFT_16853 [Dunaliella salina]|uniref:Transmembrane protein n=1 Tax=Dunaliella salina TaxID=3046 RepID=A0ABQ7G2Q8_DUNSA|nr:hypothetical protein DUNSADRAFT_16853 [Dunaliella salina]|eukprot:KAF5828892.1 hypothetical protein DUNSADRAFT_16853 [Dunaliella salina]